MSKPPGAAAASRGAAWHGALRWLRFGCLALPVLLLAAWGWRSWEAERAHAMQEVARNAQLVREYVLRLLQAQEQVLEHAATILEAAEREHASPRLLHEWLSRLDDGRPDILSVSAVSADGVLYASSRSHPVGLDISDRPYFRALRDGGRDALYMDRVVLRPGGQDTILVARPRLVEGRFAGLIVATVPIESFTAFLARMIASPKASASILRADGMLLLRHDPAARPVRLPPEMPAMRAIAQGNEGTYEATAITDGVRRIHAFARIGALPLYAHFGIAEATLWNAWRRDMLPVAALLALASVMGLVAVGHASRAIAAEEERREAEERTRRQAEADAARLAAARQAAEIQEAMLRELHHRVKNSFATVQSLVRLRAARDGEGPDRVLEQRIFALAKAHDLLHVSGLASRLDLSGFLRVLCTSSPFLPAGGRIALEVRADAVEVPVERAAPLALIVGEMIANAVQHAFVGHAGGRVSVTLQAPPPGDGMASLTVQDDGIGMPPGLEQGRNRSGLWLVRRLAAQLGGSLTVMQGAGTTVTLRFPGAVPLAEATEPPAP